MSEQETQTIDAVENGGMPFALPLALTPDEKALLLNMLENISFPSAQAKMVAAGLQAKVESQ